MRFVRQLYAIVFKLYTWVMYNHFKTDYKFDTTYTQVLKPCRRCQQSYIYCTYQNNFINIIPFIVENPILQYLK